MPKGKSEGKKPAKEESRKSNSELWTHLTFAPSKYITALNHIALRLAKIAEKSYLDSHKNFANKTLEMVEQLASKINNDFAPKPPKTLNDAYDYALSRKYQGTFLALLDEDGNLVKTVIVAKERLQDLPEFRITEEKVPMEMNARFISIPSLDIKRSIPKKAVKVVPFSSDRNQVYAYSEK